MKGFLPINDINSIVLILGSFPSVISRENNFYYANKRNRFWKIFEEYFSVVLESVDDKIEFLKNNKIALWDIVDSCNVKGSLDSNIKDINFSNLEKLLVKSPNIKTVLCNGKLSYNLTTKYVKNKDIHLNVIYLPSTSPANVSFDKKFWISELDRIFQEQT